MINCDKDKLVIKIEVMTEWGETIVKRETICSNPPIEGDWDNAHQDLGKLQRYLDNQ